MKHPDDITTIEECEETLNELEAGIEALRPFYLGEHDDLEISDSDMLCIFRGYISSLEMFIAVIAKRGLLAQETTD